jgi:anti-sigma regulatory factor (Ser/Thr protein kinase)
MQEGWSTASDTVRELGFGAGMGLPNIKKQSDDFEIISKVGVGTTLVIMISSVQ